MGKTAFATNNALTKKVYEEKLFRDSVKESYFSKFMGNTASAMVQTKTQLEKGKGDQIYFGIRMRLTGAGVTSGTQLEGNEERLTTYSASVSLERYRHAVRDDGALTRQRAVFDIDTESEQSIRDWGAEKIDSLCFTAALANPTKIFYRDGTAGAITATGTASTAKTALSATHSKLNTTLISALKAWAKTGGARSYVPIRPIKIKGREYYVLLTHPDSMYDLKIDSTFAQAMREAQDRGPENPLFEGATAIWDGVVIHEHENCTTGTDAGASSNVAWNKGLFLGAQSLCFAWGERPEVIQEEFDYKEEHGYAWAMTCGVVKPTFNSLDYGSVQVYLARTNISGL